MGGHVAREEHDDFGWQWDAGGLYRHQPGGTHLGRRFRLTPHQQREARRMRSDEGQTYAQIAALFRVSRSVVWRAVNGAARSGA